MIRDGKFVNTSNTQMNRDSPAQDVYWDYLENKTSVDAHPLQGVKSECMGANQGWDSAEH